MMTEPCTPDNRTPDLLFSRVAALLLGAGLMLSAGSLAVLGHAMRVEERAASDLRAALAAGESAHRLLAVLAAGQEEDPRAQTIIARDGLRLAGIQGLDGLGLDGPGRGGLADPDARRKLTAQLTSRLLPAIEARGRDAAERHAAAGRRARAILGGAFAATLLVGAGLFHWAVLPARRRIRDWVTRAGEADRENQFRLLHDPLTGMPNATFLHAHLTRLIAGAGRTETQTAVLRLDLDRFGMLRETLGQRTSDEILRVVGRRIRNTMRGGDFAAHLGHDDFVLVASNLTDANAAAKIAARVQAVLSKPVSVRGGTRHIGVRVGVTLVSDDQADPDLILGNADIALSEARSAGSGSVRYFREDLRREVERRETLFAELLGGMGRGELVPHFQPQIDLRSGALSGFEALVRWQHPTRGLLSPAHFLDFADETGLTERIGELVLTQSLKAIRAWDRAGLNVPRVGVNFALAQLRDPRLIEKIKWEVERLDVAPARLSIEVLETVLIKSDADMVVRNLRGLASAGFHVELDDFGTGHASISNLRRFMVDRIKIDRGFIRGIEDSAEQRELTASMIAMAGALGIGTLAEGVETEGAAATLRALGCDQFQGFLVAPAMSETETHGWLRDFAGWRPAAGAQGSQGGADPNTP